MFVSCDNFCCKLPRIESAIGAEGAKEDHDSHGHEHHDHDHDHEHDHKHGKSMLIIRVDTHFTCVWFMSLK